MELGMKKIDRLVESQGTMEHVKMIKKVKEFH